jgi:hypothetical protein
MKRTDLEKLKGVSIVSRMAREGTPGRFGKDSALPSRREQRKLDQAQGLVPFAVKLNGELVARIQALANERQAPLNDVVTELLTKGLDG